MPRSKPDVGLPRWVTPDNETLHWFTRSPKQMAPGDKTVRSRPNRKDFPREALTPYSLEVQHPDEFLANKQSVRSSVQGY
jgi:hypothetical protein